MTLTVDSLREQGFALFAAEWREKFLAWSGQKPAPELQRVYDDHRSVTSSEALEVARAFYEAARNSPAEESAPGSAPHPRETPLHHGLVATSGARRILHA